MKFILKTLLLFLLSGLTPLSHAQQQQLKVSIMQLTTAAFTSEVNLKVREYYPLIFYLFNARRFIPISTICAFPNGLLFMVYTLVNLG